MIHTYLLLKVTINKKFLKLRMFNNLDDLSGSFPITYITVWRTNLRYVVVTRTLNLHYPPSLAPQEFSLDDVL